MKESGIKNKIIARLKDRGYFVVKLHGGPTQQAGLPDILCVRQGLAYFLEVKQPGEKPTKLQEHTMAKIQAAGGRAKVVTSVDEAAAFVLTTAESR